MLIFGAWGNVRNSLSVGRQVGTGISQSEGTTTRRIIAAFAVALSLTTALSLAAPDPAEARRRASPTEIIRDPAKNDPLTIVISLSEQRLNVYDSRGLVAQSPISSGRRGNETPTGIFTILQKNKQHYSNLYNSAPMPNMQRITWSGVALHAGHLPGYPASHGCIRLPYSFSRSLFSMTQIGNRVVVHDDMIEPSAIAHPGLFAALPPGQIDVPHPTRRPEAVAARSKAAGLSTVSAMLGVTPAAAAEAAIEIAAHPDASVQLGDGAPEGPTRASALARLQSEIDSKANVIADREKLNGEAAAALADANGHLNEARQDLKGSRNAVAGLKRDVRDRERALAGAERELKRFIDRQQREMQRAETRATAREDEHRADAQSDLDTETLLKRAEARKVEADKDAADREAAARDETELEGKYLEALHDLETAQQILAAQDDIILNRENAVKATEADIVNLKKAHREVRASLDLARDEYQRAIAAVQQFSKPATVFVSRRTGMLKVRQGNAEVFATAIKMASPEAPIGTHIFTAMAYTDASETGLKWQALTLTDEAPRVSQRSSRRYRNADEEPEAVVAARAAPMPLTATNALERIELTPEVRARITELMKPGSAFIISDETSSPETGRHTDFIVQPRL